MQKGTLQKLLSTLVDECGYDRVRKSLEDFAPPMAGSPASRDSSVKRPQRQRTKSTAVATVESLPLPDEEKKSVLRVLARKYEDKTFMPNVNHVRAFLEQEGEDTTRIKSRQQVVSTVFRRLAGWETQKLRELDARGLYGPPKSFSVIAKSIESFGQQSRL